MLAPGFGCGVCLAGGDVRVVAPGVPRCAPAPTAPGRSSSPVAGADGAGQTSAGRAQSRRPPGLTVGAGPAPRGPRPRLIVVCAKPSRRPISASLTPWSRHALACSHCAAVTFPGAAGRSCLIGAADPSRFAAFHSVAT